jgi:predicted GH43/DUF377 family glycosyl hydrolase
VNFFCINGRRVNTAFLIRPCLFPVILAAVISAAAYSAERPGVIPFPDTKPRFVPREKMVEIYEETRTPYKYGVIVRGREGEMLDGPAVFRHADRWYMLYVSHKDDIGYEAELAVSDDLLEWERLGIVMPFSKSGWDAWQATGNLALFDTRWHDATHELGTWDDRFWLTYIGGASKGYEPDPLAIGLATTDDPAAPRPWDRLPEPVLSTRQPDVRDFERKTLYRSFIFRDEARTLGAPFVMFYNGKAPLHGVEAIGIAVSDDMRTWQRFGHGPVIENVGTSPWAISGNPQVVKMGDIWVMFYFGAFWQPNAFDTFAASYDLVHWAKWDGPHLIEPSEPWDRQFAHKPWLIKHDGIVYHFYCAVGDEGRVIALATSKDLGTATSDRYGPE